MTHIPVEDPSRKSLVEEFAQDLKNFGFTEIREGMPLEESIDILRRGDLKLVNT